MAGNSQTATVSGIHVDETAPTLSGALTSTPNADAWVNGDVTVHWCRSEAPSAIAVRGPADSVITGAGSDLSATATVTVKGGNQTSRSVSGIHFDRCAPVTTASASNPTFPWGWYGGPVEVGLGLSDGLC